MLTLEIDDLKKGMFSKTIKLTDSKQESSEYKAKEPLNSGDKQECGQIKSVCNENYLQGNTFEHKKFLEMHSRKTHSKAKELLLLCNLSYKQWGWFVQ